MSRPGRLSRCAVGFVYDLAAGAYLILPFSWLAFKIPAMHVIMPDGLGSATTELRSKQRKPAEFFSALVNRKWLPLFITLDRDT